MHTYLVLTSNNETSKEALAAYGAELLASRENEFIVWLWHDVSDVAFSALQQSGGYIGAIEIA